MPADSKNLYETVARPDWCPGCGNFGIHVAMKRAFGNLGLDPDHVAIVSDIGCSGKMPHWINTYGLHSLHGRAVACASGVKWANSDLTVLVSVGDGGAYGIGVGHLIHAIRRNVDMTVIVHNNRVYGLTKGQMTPTSEKGFVTPSSPFGVVEEPLNPLALALSMGGSFVARGYSGDAGHLTALIEEGVKHKGFALIDVFQPCVTFNKEQTFEYYSNNLYKLEEKTDYDTSDWELAMKTAQETEKLPIGVLYQASFPIYEDLDPGKAGLPVTKLPIEKIDISDLMQKYY
jgi:2-oxoglutarate/2-oxoacid ferredoxin oxidoreductase subunit beta